MSQVWWLCTRAGGDGSSFQLCAGSCTCLTHCFLVAFSLSFFLPDFRWLALTQVQVGLYPKTPGVPVAAGALALRGSPDPVSTPLLSEAPGSLEFPAQSMETASR